MRKKTGLDQNELNSIYEAEREAIYSVTLKDEPEETVEMDSEQPSGLFPTVERLSRFPHQIPIKGLEAPLLLRIQSRLVDYVLIFVPVFLMDGLFHLSNVVRFVMGDLPGLKKEDYDYYVFLSTRTWSVLMDHPFALLRIMLFFFALLFLYRLVFYLTVRRTLGNLFMGVMMTSADGKHPGFMSLVLKALSTTLADACLIGTPLDLIFYLTTSPRATTTDVVSGMRAVRQDEWARLASRLLDRMNRIRREGLLHSHA